MDEFTKEINQRTLSNSNNRDKALITISSAIIAGTVTLLDAGGLGWGVFILFGSWVFFLVTVVLVLLSFDVSNSAHGTCLELHEFCDAVEKGNQQPDPDNEIRLNEQFEKAEERLKLYNGAAFWTFVIGLIILMCFGIYKIGGDLWEEEPSLKAQTLQVEVKGEQPFPVVVTQVPAREQEVVRPAVTQEAKSEQ